MSHHIFIFDAVELDMHTLAKRVYRVQHGFHETPQCITATFTRLDKKLVSYGILRYLTQVTYVAPKFSAVFPRRFP